MPKMLVTSGNRKFIIKDEDKDVHTNFGMISSTDIKNAKVGETIKSNKGIEFTLTDVSFIDLYRRIKRGAQIIPEKDIGLIITEAGLNRDSLVIEAGSGSGALGCFLAKMCKTIYSYEIREDHFKIVKSNLELLDITNMDLKNKDAKLGFDETEVDAVILDMPDPWEMISQARNALKIGGFLVSYSPTIPQVMDFVNKLDDSFNFLKTCEIIEREWEVSLRKVRPRSQAIGHSGFLSFARRVK
jgi:tRNA (adenine57-N1/adenine58-N1)-methyltransferase